MTDVSTGDDSSTPDWGAQLSTSFLDLVDGVRGKTTGPILKVARALVYGLVIIVAALMMATFVLIALVRLVDNLVPGAVWGTYLILGGVFLLLGMILWSRRTP